MFCHLFSCSVFSTWLFVIRIFNVLSLGPQSYDEPSWEYSLRLIPVSYF